MQLSRDLLSDFVTLLSEWVTSGSHMGTCWLHIVGRLSFNVPKEFSLLLTGLDVGAGDFALGSEVDTDELSL